MYPTFSNNINRDNASVYSGNSTHTSNSIAYRNGPANNSRMIPRSNSTSDLFDIPLYGNGNSRKKKLPIKQSPALRQPLRASHSTTSLATHNSGRIPAHVQRSQLHPNFQQKYDQHHKKRYHKVEIPYKPQQQHLSNYEYQPQHSFTYNTHPGNSLNSIPERHQARNPANHFLTPYQLQRRQMKNSFQFPNGENFTPRNKSGTTLLRSSSAISLNNSNGPSLYALSRSQSMNSLPLKVERLPNAMTVASSSSPVTCASSTSSNNSMREHSSSDSTNLSSGPSTHSSNTALAKSAISPGDVVKKKASISISTHSQNTIRVNKDDIKLKTNTQLALQGKSKSKNSKLGTFFRRLFSSSSSSSSIAPSVSSSLLVTTKKREKRRKYEPEVSISSVTTVPAPKKLPKEKQNAEITHSTGSNSIAEDGFGVGCKGNEFSDNDDNDEEDDDEDDDILMDTDLVFDSLLLKANSNRQSFLQKQHDLQEKLQKLTSSDTSNDTLADQKKESNASLEEESAIDYELIAEFSKLGEYINETPTITAMCSPRLPPRSTRRPNLANKESARFFYHPSHGGSNSTEELLRRLYRDWKTVHIDRKHSPSTEPQAQDYNLKTLRFSGDIYINDTWSPLEYQRSDRRFIKNRRRMMQLENEGFIQEIKVELNEFKRCDMIVHEESVQFTHYFL